MERNFISQVFDSVYHRYDIMNSIMSFGMHHMWKNDFCACINHSSNAMGLDIATGTGDIAYSLSERYNIIGSDPSINMMKKYSGVKVCCIAESLPFHDQSFDFATVAFGYRNFTDRTEAVKQILRVLKPYGVLYCLEFSKPHHSLDYIYKMWLKFIPVIGDIIAKNRSAYQYLADSIIAFPNANELKSNFYDYGFNKVEYFTLTFGIVAVHICYKQ